MNADAVVVLIDLSSIAYPIYLMSQANPDANHASQQIVARVRALANGHSTVAICCDSGRSFRHELTPSYKANRPEREAPLHHQIQLATEQLQADGFPIWLARGFEADDVIATATAHALGVADTAVLIVSADKDLLQLVGDRVTAKSVRDGSILDAAAVLAKFGVQPAQMRDYLTLVGDASDNIAGAKGIGPKTAAALLTEYGSLDVLYVELQAHGTKFKPSVATSLRELQPRLETVRALITLRTDVEIPFEEIAHERVPKEVATFGMEGEDAGDPPDIAVDMAAMAQGAMNALAEPSSPNGTDSGRASVDAATITSVAPRLPQSNVAASVPNAEGSGAPSQALAVREPDALAPPPAEWERQLDPRSMSQVIALAKNLYESRMFSAYGTPQAVLSTIMVGRELGLPAMASLRGIHNIEGRHALSASLMVALILKSGMAEYFRPVSISETEATYETLRRGPGQQPFTLTHTIAMAVTAQLVKKDSNWMKVPTDMLVARCQSRLARLIYPDLIAGLYTPDELTEINATRAA